MGRFKCASKSSSCPETGVLPPIQRKTSIDPVSDNYKQLFISSKTESFAGVDSTNGSKRAVVPVQNKNSLGFYSCLFLVPKPENKWRPVIDLSVVNTYLYVPTFKMETAKVIRASLRTGE